MRISDWSSDVCSSDLYCSHGHEDLFRDAAETGLELDVFIAQSQAIGGQRADVQCDLTIVDMRRWHHSIGVDRYNDMRGVAAVGTPLVQRAYQVGLGRGLLHDVLAAHDLPGRRKAFDISGRGENALGIVLYGGCLLGRFDTVV